MLRGGVSMAIASIWTSMANWSTPTILFCALNLMIIIIFIASNSKSPTHHHHHHPNNPPGQIVRSPSLLERVKSVNLSSFYATTDSRDHYGDQYETTGYSSVGQLNRRPSLLQRVKSIDFSFSSYYTSPPDQSYDSHAHHHESEQTHQYSPSQLARVPSLLERFKSIKFSTESEPLSNLTGDQPEVTTRVPSLLDRIKAFKATPAFSSDHHSGNTFSSHDQQSDGMDLAPHQDSARDNDETKMFDKGSTVVTGAKLERSSETLTKKSRGKNQVAESKNSDVHVDQSGTTLTKATIIGRNKSVDAKADDFIKRFKQQQKLQRIDSLQRFREMLGRSC